MKPKFKTGDRVRVVDSGRHPAAVFAYKGFTGTVIRLSWMSDQDWLVELDVASGRPDSAFFCENDLALINGLDQMLDLL